MSTYYFAIFFILGLALPSQAGEWIRLGPTTIAFHGTIEKDEFRRFDKVYKPTDETIILNSGGGAMSAALDIGRILIQNEKLTAVVEGGCHSSCANYFFLAAKTKKINGGIVGFHGNWKAMANTDMFKAQLSALAPSVKKQWLDFHARRVQDESEFMRKAGVSQELFDRTQKENDEGVYDVYLPGSKQFEIYGVRVLGEQDLTRARGLNVLYENGPGENNAEELKALLNQEFYQADQSRRVQIRHALKVLTEQFPLNTYPAEDVTFSSSR